MILRIPHPSSAVGTALLLGFTAGCGKEPEIGHYREPRVSQADSGDATVPKKAQAPEGEAAPTRYLNAIVPQAQGGKSWFFKMSGPPGEISAIEPAFQKFLASLKFPKDGGDRAPAWVLPEGWTEGPPRAMRLATILVPSGSAKTELSVTLFGGDVKANIDRWRAELGLPPLGAIGDDEYKKTVRESTVDGLKVYAVDMQGSKKPGGGMMPPFMKP